QRQRNHATRVVELHRDDFTYPDTVEVDTASVAQARRGALEDDAQGAALLGGVQALEPQHEAEGGRNHRQCEGSDQDVVRPCFHSDSVLGPETASQHQDRRFPPFAHDPPTFSGSRAYPTTARARLPLKYCRSQGCCDAFMSAIDPAAMILP